jgi:stage III sporulation protein AB
VIRFIGAILITAGAGAWGFLSVLRLRRRANILLALSGAIEIMKSEVYDRLTPMPELMRLLMEDTPYPVSALFRRVHEKMETLGRKPFSSLWSAAIAESPELLLKEEERRAISELGYFLGRYDAGEQKSALVRVQRRMEEYARRAEAERDKKTPVHAFLGVAAGVFVSVLLL